MKCPVEKCKHVSRNKQTVWAHLYNAHRKNELITALLKLVKE